MLKKASSPRTSGWDLPSRVSAAEETEGLDVGEHGIEAYPGFASDPDPIGGSDGHLHPGATAVSGAVATA